MEQTRAARLEAALRLTRKENAELIEAQAALLVDHEQLWSMLREVMLRVQFTMEYFQFKKTPKPGGLTDANGAPLNGDPVSVTLYDIFCEKRDEFAARMESRLAPNQPAKSTPSSPEPPSPGTSSPAVGSESRSELPQEFGHAPGEGQSRTALTRVPDRAVH